LYTATTHFPFTRAVIRIGGAAGSDLSLASERNPSISPHHARIEWTGSGFRLLDRSTCGTWVNGERVTSVMLAEGNIIEFGPGGPKFAVQSIETPQGGLQSKALADLEDAIESLERKDQTLRRRSFLLGGLVAAACVGGVGVWQALRPDPDEIFKRLSKQHAAALLLVYCRFRILIEHQGEQIVHQEGDSFGTGFFVSYEGHVITNRHVVEPWFGQDDYAQSLAAACASHGEAAVSIDSTLAAWPANSRFKLDDHVDYAVGFNKHARRNLEIVGMPTFTPVEQDIDGVMVERIPHDDSDLALLHLRHAEVVPGSVPALLSAGERPEVLTEVLAGGFPQGARILEGSEAVPTFTRGWVKKVEKTFQIDLSVAGGSSGSPVLDLGGRVLGVATRAGEGRHVELIPAAAIRELARQNGVELVG
jgi:hypothetical protein